MADVAAPPPPPAQSLGWPSRVPVGPLLGVVVGVVDGISIANGFSQPELGSLAGAVYAMLSAGLGGGLLLVAAVLGATRWRGAGRAVASVVFGAAVGLVPGLLVAAPMGLTYHAPVILETNGTATLAPEGPAITPVADSPAHCVSLPDRTDVASVTFLGLGELGGGAGTLRGMASFDVDPSFIHLEFEVEGADAAGGPGPTWAVNVPTTSLVGAPADGAVAFAAPRVAVEAKPGDPVPTPFGSIPASIAGSVRWSCASWNDAKATPPPDGTGTLDLALDGVAFVPAAKAPARCSSITEEGPAEVAADLVGTMQGWPFAIDLGMEGGPRVGGTMRIWILAAGKDPPPGVTYSPNWMGTATITEVGEGGTSGRATFDALPTGVDPSVGPAPTGWPTTVRGAVAWACHR